MYIKEHVSRMFRIHWHVTHWPLFSRKHAWCPNYSLNPFWIIIKPLFYLHKNIKFDLKGNGIWTKNFSLDVRLNFSGSRGSPKEKEKVHRLYFSTCLGLMGNFMQESPGKTQINYQVSIYFIGGMLSWNWAVSEVVRGLGEGACIQSVSATSLGLNEREGHILLGKGRRAKKVQLRVPTPG